jgi:hypothetical protein
MAAGRPNNGTFPSRLGRRPSRLSVRCRAQFAIAAVVTLAIAIGCSSGAKTGPPTLPSGIDHVVIEVQYMSGVVVRKAVTDPDDIASLRDSINRLPRPGKRRTCITDRGAWTLTFTGNGVRKTATFDATGCSELHVRDTDGTLAIRQGNEPLRAQFSSLIA